MEKREFEGFGGIRLVGAEPGAIIALATVGEVGRAWFEPHRDPLLYFRDKFR